MEADFVPLYDYHAQIIHINLEVAGVEGFQNDDKRTDVGRRVP